MGHYDMICKTKFLQRIELYTSHILFILKRYETMWISIFSGGRFYINIFWVGLYIYETDLCEYAPNLYKFVKF